MATVRNVSDYIRDI